MFSGGGDLKTARYGRGEAGVITPRTNQPHSRGCHCHRLSATGDVVLDGISLMRLAESELRKIRGFRVSMVMQDPFTMLNPLMRSGDHIDEMLRGRPEFASRASRASEVKRRLAEVGIADEDVARRTPFQLSGGMCKRIALAAALARDPELLIADEPSTALDVTTQAEIITLLRRVQRERQMSLILITHNLRLAFSTCQRIYMLYAGSLLEVGDAAAVERQPFPSLHLETSAVGTAGRGSRDSARLDSGLRAARRRCCR
jgi:peptide/nickel transport system ATP-binding protein